MIKQRRLRFSWCLTVVGSLWVSAVLQAADDPSQHAVAYLQALRDTPGALGALQTLTGTVLPPTGNLTPAQSDALYFQLFTANGGHTQAYDHPTDAAQAVVAGGNYLTTLRQTSGGLAALQNITGQGLPPEGKLTGGQVDFLFTQLYDAQGNKTPAFNAPTAAVQAVVSADHYLTALRQTPGALSALTAITGKTLPASGTLQPVEIQFLFGQLFDSKGVPNNTYSQPQQAVDATVHAASYLQALRQTSGALDAIKTLTGQTLPGSGSLDGPQTDFLFGQLADASGNPSAQSKDPVAAAQSTVHAVAYLQALRQTPGALAAVTAITGTALPDSGSLSEPQIDFLVSQLFDASGNKTAAYSAPLSTVGATVQAASYLQSLRQTPGALNAVAMIAGKDLPAGGALSKDQAEFLFSQLFDAAGNPTSAATNPVTAAAATVQAANYLQALRQTPGALSAANSLSGKVLPASGSLTKDQTDFLFSQLFDATGKATGAATDPTAAAAANVQAANYLQALRQTPGALSAANSLSGKVLPASGSLTKDQTDFLFSQLFDATGKPTRAATDPTAAAAANVQAANYLQALRQTPGALDAVHTISGGGLPATGTLSKDQAEFLFSQLFDVNGKPTTAATNPSGAATATVEASNYLQALRLTPGALDAANMISGKTLPVNGALSKDQMDFLFSQLFDASGKPTTAASNPSAAAAANVQAANYLVALRQTPGALDAFGTISGQSLSAAGALTGDQAKMLFAQLFDVSGQPTLAYRDPAKSAESLSRAASYLQALRQTPGALTALQALTGQSFSANGTLTSDQAAFLFSQLFDAMGNPTNAYHNPSLAVTAQVHAADYLNVLRQTPGALDALQALSGQSFPMSGSLTSAQSQYLFAQLFDAAGNPTAAYNSPTAAAQAQESALGYLEALRQTPGALLALQSLTGQQLPADGALSAAQAQYLFSQLFDAQGNSTAASKTPGDAARTLTEASAYLDALRQTPGALQAYAEATGQTLPASGPLTPEQIQNLVSTLFDAHGKPTLAAQNPTAAAGELVATQKGTGSWLLKGILAIIGGVVAGGALAASGVLSPAVSALVGAGVGAALFGIFSLGGAKSSSMQTDAGIPTSTPVAVLTATPRLAIPALSNFAAGNDSGGQSLNTVSVLSSASQVVSAVRPDQAYIPMFSLLASGQSVRSPQSIAADYAQRRWVSTAQGNGSAANTQAALTYAGAADKNAGIVVQSSQ